MKKANQSIKCMYRTCRCFKGLCQSYFPRILSFNSHSRIGGEALGPGKPGHGLETATYKTKSDPSDVYSFNIIVKKAIMLMRKSLCLGFGKE